MDAQHGLDTLNELSELSRYLSPIELNTGEVLPWVNQTHHGLYFIEYGQLRIEHSADYTTTAANQNTFPSPRQVNALASSLNQDSIGHLNARSGTLGREAALFKRKAKGPTEMTEQSFRLARIGPGWVVGMIEECSGMRRSGVYVCGRFAEWVSYSIGDNISNNCFS